jgi:putative selenium metabolism protein SsnA
MLITNGKLITWDKPNQILPDWGVYIQDGKISEIGPSHELATRHPHEQQIDAEGQYVMPGNICAHTHFYGAFSRGMAIPGAAPDAFPQILSKLWWPLDRSLTLPDVRASAEVCLVEAIRHGTTTLIDHHASQNAVSGSLDEIASAVEQSGLRAALCYEVTDRDGEARMRDGIDENVRFIERVREEKPAHGRLGAMFGLHASLTLSDRTLQACRDALPQGAGFHIHVAEHSIDEYDSLAKSGMRIVDRLAKFGILGPKTIVVHAVHIDAKEISLLADSGTWVVHNPRSNMNNAVGLPVVEQFLRAGIRACLGNDGFSNTMWEEWKTAYLVHKLWNADPRRMNAADLAQMAVYNNAALAETLFDGEKLGVIVPGAQADLIFVDYHPFTPMTEGNLPWHIVFGFHESMVTATIVDGKALMYQRKLLTMDEEAVTQQAMELSPAVWARYNAKFA